MSHKLTRLAEDRIDPVKGDWIATNKVLYPFLNNIAYTGQAFVPGVGFHMIFASTADMRKREMMDRGMSREDAFIGGQISASFEAPVERLTAGLLVGDTPFLGAFINKVKQAPLRAVAAQVGINTVVNSAENNIQEALQDASPIILQQIAHTLNDEMPDTPEGTWEKWATERSDVAWATLPLTAIGVASRTRIDIQIASDFIGNEDNLKLVGIPEKFRKEILETKNANDRVKIYREAWKERKQEIADEAKGEMQASVDDFDAQQADPTSTTIDRRIDENSGKEFYRVTSPDGQFVDVASKETAQELAKQFDQDKEFGTEKEFKKPTTEVSEDIDGNKSNDVKAPDGSTTMSAPDSKKAKEVHREESDLADEQAKTEEKTGVKSEAGSKVVVTKDEKGKETTVSTEPRVHLSNDQTPVNERKISIKNKILDKVREKLGLSKLSDPERQRRQDVIDTIQSKYNGEELSDKAEEIAAQINEGRAVEENLTEAEMILLIQIGILEDNIAKHQQKAIDAGTPEARKFAEVKIEALLDSMDNLSIASRGIGTELGRALAARQSFLDKDTYRLSNMLRIATFKKGEPLTNEEKLKIADQAREIEEAKKRIDALEDELQKAQQEALVAAAKQAIAEESKPRTRKASPKTRAAKRRQIKKKIKEMGYRVNDITGAIGMSFELGSLLAQLAVSHIQDGMSDLDSVVAAVQKDVPDASNQDILNALSGRSPAARQRAVTEAERRVKELKKLAGLEAEINDALNRIFELKGKKLPKKESKQLEALKAKLSSLRYSFVKNIKDEKQLTRVLKQLAVVEDALDANIRRVSPTAKKHTNNAITMAVALLRDARNLQDTISKIDDLVAIEAGLASEVKSISSRKPGSPELKAKQDELALVRKEIATQDSLKKQIDALENDIMDKGEDNHRNGKNLVDSKKVKALRERLNQLKEDRKIQKPFRKGSQKAIDDKLEDILERTAELEKTGIVPKGRTPAPKRIDVKQAQEAYRDLVKLTKTNASVDDLKEQLRTGNIRVAPALKKQIASEDLQKARIKEKQLKRRINDVLRDMKKPTGVDRLRNVLLGSRTLLATGDMSFLLRQGLILGSSRIFRLDGMRPRVGAAPKAFVGAFRAFFSQNTADDIELAIRAMPEQFDRDRAGLFISSLDSPVREREEDFMSKSFGWIPDGFNVIRASERNMITGLNLLRIAAFDEFARKNPNATIEQLKAYATFVNHASGRGDLKLTGDWSQAVASIFFAPRFAMSRIQITKRFILETGKFATGKGNIVNKAIMRDFASTVTLGLSFMAMAKAAGADVGMDPEESDFGKIVVGDTRIDVWGGVLQPARIVAGFIFGGENAAKNLGNFFLYKTSPLVQIPATLRSGKNIIGQDQGRIETVIRSVSPLALQEAVDVGIHSKSVVKGVAAGLGSGIGLGIQEHD
jgi:hypothetical protein